MAGTTSIAPHLQVATPTPTVLPCLTSSYLCHPHESWIMDLSQIIQAFVSKVSRGCRPLDITQGITRRPHVHIPWSSDGSELHPCENPMDSPLRRCHTRKALRIRWRISSKRVVSGYISDFGVFIKQPTIRCCPPRSCLWALSHLTWQVDRRVKIQRPSCAGQTWLLPLAESHLEGWSQSTATEKVTYESSTNKTDWSRPVIKDPRNNFRDEH